MKTRPTGSVALLVRGAVAGATGGVVFALAATVAAALAGGAPLEPLRLFASVVLGQDALARRTPTATAVLVGLGVNAVVTSAWGLVYGALAGLRTARTRPGTDALVGAAFGLCVWAVDFLVLAPPFFPWFREASGFAALHALAYGSATALVFSLLGRVPAHAAAH